MNTCATCQCGPAGPALPLQDLLCRAPCTRLAVSLVLLAVLAPPSPVWGARGQQTVIDLAAAQVKAAERRLKEARIALRAEQGRFDSFVQAEHRRFEATTEYQEALAEEEHAKHIQVAKQAEVLKVVRDTPAWKAAKAEELEARSTLEKLPRDCPFQERADAAERVMIAASVVTRIEGAALDASPTVVAARETVQTATANRRALTGQFTQSLKTSDGWQQLKAAIAAAELAVDRANAALDKTRAQYKTITKNPGRFSATAKWCSACDRFVSPLCGAGDLCPWCDVVWDSEKKVYR